MFRTYVVSSVLLVVACGGKRTGSPAGAGGSGGSGVAGMAGGGGASGGAGTSGMAGTTTGAAGTGVAGAGGAGPGGGAGTVGAGGASGAAGGASGAAGGASGTSGTSGTRFGAECRTAADCVLVSDCCACRAEPKGAQVATCLATCAVDACAAIQIEAREVTCTLDRCVLARTCDTRAVNCLADPASCPPGTVHSVRDRCWGPCLPPTECNHVAACSSCGAESVCVREQVTGGIAFGCVTPAPDCRAGNYCGCLEACPGLCAERDGGPECICGGC
jgi:hypothetical protein